MNQDQFNRDLLQFIQCSPTPFHAVSWMVAQLEAQGFQRLRMEDRWDLQPGQRYYCTRNDSSIVAFVHGKSSPVESGIRMVGAHTDSPCLRVKPSPEVHQKGLLQLGVEVYGGVLLNPWFDRDLSLAGRVIFTDGSGELDSCLINFVDPIAVIPSLAIHLDREVNSNRCINPQKDITPILCLSAPEEKLLLSDLLVEQIKREHPQIQVAKIFQCELSLYDTQPPAIIGLRSEFIASARLDNLASCYLGLKALLDAEPQFTSMLICNDHEEVGSQSAVGAQGPLARDILGRLLPDNEQRVRALERSLLVSADNAHAVHPNYPDRHDGNHGPRLNGGPVIKVNANQRYATNSESSALFQKLCEEEGVTLQYFVSRNDMPCGSTIGPLTAMALGVATLDVGVPTYAMHSPRELAGTEDAYNFYRSLKRFMGLERVRI